MRYRQFVLIGLLLIGSAYFVSWPPLKQLMLERQIAARLISLPQAYDDVELTIYVNRVLDRVVAQSGYEGVSPFAVISDANSPWVAMSERPEILALPLVSLAMCNSEDELAALLTTYIANAHFPNPIVVQMTIQRSPTVEQLEQRKQDHIAWLDQIDDWSVEAIVAAGYNAEGMIGICSHPSKAEFQVSDVGDARETILELWRAREDRRRRQAIRQNEIRPGPPLLREQYLTAIETLAYGSNPQEGVVRGNTYYDPRYDVVLRLPVAFSSRGPKEPSPFDSVYPVFPNAHRQPRDIMDFRSSDHEGLAGSRGTLQFIPRQAEREFVTYLDQQTEGMRNLFGDDQGEVRHGPYQEMLGTTSVQYALLDQTSRFGRTSRLWVQYQLKDSTVFRLRIDSGSAYVSPPVREDWLELVRGFRPLVEADQAFIRPLSIEIVEVEPSDTVSSIAARMVLDMNVEREFRLLNGLYPDGDVEPGQLVKIVVEQTPTTPPSAP